MLTAKYFFHLSILLIVRSHTTSSASVYNDHRLLISHIYRLLSFQIPNHIPLNTENAFARTKF